MAFLNERDSESVKNRFEKLVKPVKLINFTQELECQFCSETRTLLVEIAGLSDKISLEIYNFQFDKVKSKEFEIDKIPATVVMADKDVGIRFYGIPSGYEFASLIESILMVSTGISNLSQHSVKKLEKINKKVHIQVFVTPTCPYCPSAVITGHAMAMTNKFIKADMVEATEFPHLANKYKVMGVPRVIVNEDIFFEGALEEDVYVEKVLQAVQK